jgi:hypothetical protein
MRENPPIVRLSLYANRKVFEMPAQEGCANLIERERFRVASSQINSAGTEGL